MENNKWVKSNETDEFGIVRVTYRDQLGNKIVRDGIPSMPYSLYRAGDNGVADYFTDRLYDAKGNI